MDRPSREFWRLIVQEVVWQYCVGEPAISLFVKNVPALQVCVCVHVYHEGTLIDNWTSSMLIG